MQDVFNPQQHQPSEIDYDILAGVPPPNKNYQGSLDGAFNSLSPEERQKYLEQYQKVRGTNNVNHDIPGATARMASVDPK